MSFYPKLEVSTLKNLAVLRKLMAEHPDYLNDPTCEYSSEILELLRKEPSKSVPATEKEVEELDLLTEVLTTYRDLNLHKPDMGDAAAVQGYYRTKTALLTKLADLKDKSLNQKSMGEFYSKVLEILDEIATPTQRTVFQQKLSEFAL